MNTPKPTTGEIRPNSTAPRNTHRPAAAKPTEGASAVAFAHAEAGHIDLHGDGSYFSGLLVLGGMVTTRRYEKSAQGHVTATDRRGLEEASNLAQCAATSAVRGIGATAKALALAAEELNAGEVSEIGWLLHSLAGLAAQLDFEGREIEHELRRDFGREEGGRDAEA